MKTKLSILIILLSLFTISCRYDFNLIPRKDNIEERSPGFSKIDSPFKDSSSKDKFSVLLIGDTHFGRNGWFKPKRNEEPFYEKLTQLKKDYEAKKYPISFSINVGDISDSGKQSEFDDFRIFEKRIASILSADGASYYEKMFSIVGNHDLYNNGWNVWKENSFPHTSTYYFTTEGTGSRVSWYFLDSGSGMLGKNQISKLTDIARKDPNEKLFFSHYPINAKFVDYYTLSDPLEVAQLTKLIYQTKVGFTVEGHYHPGGSNDIKTSSGKFVCHEEVLPGFVDHLGFGILTVDLSSEKPDFNLKIYHY